MKNYTGIIFRKELLDIIRDRRSVVMTFLLPLVLYPMMFWFIGSQVASELSGPSQITLAVDSASVGLQDLLRSMSDENTNIWPSDDAVAEVRSGSADAAVFAELDGKGSVTAIKLVYDSNKTSSSSAMNEVYNRLTLHIQQVQEQKLAEMNISLASLAPYSIETATMEAVSGEAESGAGMFLSMMLPMIMVILLSVGGMATAVDLFAGEKERRTFEPLLCTGARRTDILAGKLGAVTVMSLLSAFASVAGIALGYIANPSAMTLGLDDAHGLSISPSKVLFIILIVAALAVFFSGLHILLSTYARTVKEASTYGSFVMLASYVPVFASMTKLGGDFSTATAFIPVMNVTGCLKKVLAGIDDTPYFIITFGITLAFVAIVLILGRMMFKKENIMLRA